MTHDDRSDEADDGTIRDAITSTGQHPTPEFVASLRASLTDAAAGRTTTDLAPPRRRPLRWRPLLAAAGVLALVATAVVVLGTRVGDGEVATVPPPSSEPPGVTTEAPADHPSTAEQLTAWIGVRLNGVGNGAIDGQYPWFVIESVDVATDSISVSGDDGCNAWAANGTIVDGRFEYADGESTLQDCGPGTFSLWTGDAFIVRDDGIDIERAGIVYRFGPDPVVEDAATLIDRRRFVETSGARPFPFSISFDGDDVVGFDGCGLFGATAEYTATSVRLTEVESQCATSVTPVDGDVVEHVGGNTVELRRGGDTVVQSLVAESESFPPPTTEWLLGDWAVGWGRVIFRDDGAAVGRCDTTWQASDGVVLVAPWGDCVTGLFPGDPTAEATLRTVLEAPVVHRLLPSNDVSEGAAILASGVRSVRMVRIEEVPPSSSSRLFALTELDGQPFEHDRLPTVAVLGSGSGTLARGTDGCGEYSITGTRTGSDITVGEVTAPESCGVLLPPGFTFAPGSGTTITVDGSELTATDAAGRVGRFIEVGALEQALVSDLLDPLSGTGVWRVNGLTIELTGPPGTGVLGVGACQLPWAFGTYDAATFEFSGLTVEGTPEAIFGCVDSDRGHDAAGLLAMLARASTGTGAEIRLGAAGELYLIWDTHVVRLTSVGAADQDLLNELVARTWIGVDGPWRTTSPTLVFDSLNREPGLNAVAIDTGCNRGDGTFRLDGDRMITTQITVEEAGCDHEVTHLTEGTTLAVDDGVLTVTSASAGSTLTTTYVAVDALADVAPADVSGDWLANGTPITVDGPRVTSSSDEVVGVLDVVRAAVAGESAAVYRYRDDGWIVAVDGKFVQLAPS